MKALCRKNTKFHFFTQIKVLSKALSHEHNDTAQKCAKIRFSQWMKELCYILIHPFTTLTPDISVPYWCNITPSSTYVFN